MNEFILAKGNICINVQKLPNEIPFEIENIVQEIWFSEKEKLGDALFDGDVLVFDSFEKNSDNLKINAVLTKYRYIVAKRKNPALHLNGTVVGVSGVTFLKEKNKLYLVFAQRSPQMFLAPDMIEVVPSGVIDSEFISSDFSVDYISNLVKEFEEETLLSKECIEKIWGWHLIQDTIIDSVDICGFIKINASKKEILDSLAKSKEYYKPVIIDFNDLTQFIEKNKNKMTLLTYNFCKIIIEEKVLYNI